MSLVALLLAFVLERGLTVALSLREPRWLDRYCDWAAGRASARTGRSPVLAAAIAILLPVMPVAAGGKCPASTRCSRANPS
jgi:hypothetical protein